ncbi:hypothetical protein PPERSA_00304 [Pseudocohnilembus persalinus]|uniref:Uncharacterized protein n=1 Tax=Pseudocohnilembus persalinus TaxID=266149 RepID=A0A0V0Q903_PSEPJ|nr:hypothetical protein PPERSA_00304 [Pseudocohnilembus persalinus]|eukprot:KRW98716.1 hypothetical protein PPERSA_00304 [Pseudocohnilembus persalinus]
MTYEAGSTDINVNKKNFGMRHEINIIKLQKWVRRRLTKLKFLSKLRDSIKKKYIVLYRGRQYDKYGVLQRLQILESVFYPKVYWVAMEQINCICLNEDGIKLNTTHELSKSLACEIAEDENPWKYFQVSYKNNTVELKQQQLFWKKLEFHGYPFIVIIYRHFEPERTQVQLRADKELSPDFEFKRGEYITPSIARAIIKSSTPEDHFLVRPLKQEFRLVDPAIKNRSAIKIQRFIRSIFGRLKARNERQRQIRHRIEAAKKIQIYYIYYKWRVHFWAERVVEYKFLKYSQSLVLKKQLGLLKQTFEKVKFRRKMAAKIWILYKYAKWRKAWKKKWMAKRNFAATRIQIYVRYYIWRKVWVKRYKEMKRQQAAKRLQIYARYKIWWKRWHVKYVYKRNRGASRIQLYWKYKKWQVQWKAQWRKRRFMAAALITSLTVLLPFIIENPEEEEKQDEEEQNEKSSQNNQDMQESGLKDKLQEKENNEENKNLQGEIIMKEQMFHFIINRDPELVDRYQGGVESLQQPYFNTTQQKLSRCITYFFAHKLQQVKIFPYKEKLSEPNRYFDIDVQNKTGEISRKLKIYVAVLTIQKIFRSTLQMLLRKGIMCYPQSDYQLIQEVSHPLFIFTKDFGFTVSFSFMAQKEQNQKHVIKLNQFFGNQLKFGMNYDEELTVIYKTKTQRQKMYSIRKIRYGLEYHCTLVYILQPGDIYDLRLYINGTMEGQTSMRKFDRMRLPSTFEFIGGTIYNEFVMTKAISAKEVFDLYIERLYVLEYQWFNYKKPNKRRRYLRGITKVKNQEGVHLNQNNQVKKYNQNRIKSGLKKKNIGLSINGIQNQSFLSQASINTEQKEIIKQEKFQYQVKQNLTINKFIRSLAQEILRNKERILILCQILSPCLNGSENLNFECLNTQLSSGNIKNNLEGEYVIEIERFLQILQNCEINTTVADLGELALLTKTLKIFKYTDEKNDKTQRYTGIFYYKIVQVLRDILQPHQGFLKQNQQSQHQQKQEIQEVQMPDIPDDWNTGAFQVGITHCTNCNYHQLTGWHQEIEFVEVFNDIGIFLKEVFPNIIVKGNQIKPSKMEHFDIYIRGVNSKNLLDIRPHYIYKKQSQMEDFLKNYTKKLVNVYDQLVFMIFKFMKFSEEMAQFQEMMFQNNQKVLPAEYKGVHNHPYELSEDQTKNIPVYKSKRCKYFKKEDQNYNTK